MANNHSMRRTLSFFLLLLSALAGISCQKVIEVDLNSSSPRIVIEANISDQPGPYVVKLSQSVNFDQTNTFPPVTGAVITVSDNVGNVDTLKEITAGTYETSALQGTPGRTYTLHVSANGKTYVATSTMPFPVSIESLGLESIVFGRENTLVIDVHFKDPAGIANYYRFVEIRNGIQQNFIFLIDDRAQDGTNMTSVLFADKDTLYPNDLVEVLLQSIDRNVYNYFTTARQIIDQGGPQLASPTNPPSNISNGALGYFSAYSVRSQSIIIPNISGHSVP